MVLGMLYCIRCMLHRAFRVAFLYQSFLAYISPPILLISEPNEGFVGPAPIRTGISPSAVEVTRYCAWARAQEGSYQVSKCSTIELLVLISAEKIRTSVTRSKAEHIRPLYYGAILSCPGSELEMPTFTNKINRSVNMLHRTFALNRGLSSFILVSM